MSALGGKNIQLKSAGAFTQSEEPPGDWGEKVTESQNKRGENTREGGGEVYKEALDKKPYYIKKGGFWRREKEQALHRGKRKGRFSGRFRKLGGSRLRI